jgi:hypothetical protein
MFYPWASCRMLRPLHLWGSHPCVTCKGGCCDYFYEATGILGCAEPVLAVSRAPILNQIVLILLGRKNYFTANACGAEGAVGD